MARPIWTAAAVPDRTRCIAGGVLRERRARLLSRTWLAEAGQYTRPVYRISRWYERIGDARGRRPGRRLDVVRARYDRLPRERRAAGKGPGGRPLVARRAG